MDQPGEQQEPSIWRDLGRAIARRDWASLKYFAGGGVACALGLIVIIAVIGWLDGVAYRNNMTSSDIMSWVVGLVIGAGALVLGLWALFWIGLAAIAFWPMTIIFVLIGGFMGGGWGAFVGAVLSGLIALGVEKLKQYA